MHLKLNADEEQLLKGGLQYLLRAASTEVTKNAILDILKKFEKPEKVPPYQRKMPPCATELFNRMQEETGKNMYHSVASVLNGTKETDVNIIAERYAHKKRNSFPISKSEMPALIEMIYYVKNRTEAKRKARSM